MCTASDKKACQCPADLDRAPFAKQTPFPETKRTKAYARELHEAETMGVNLCFDDTVIEELTDCKSLKRGPSEQFLDYSPR